MSGKLDIPVVEKRPAASRLFNMNFAAQMAANESIVSVVSWTSSPSGVTIGTPVGANKQAQVRLSGGLDGIKYLQTVVVTTSLGNTLQGEGYLFVRDASYS